MLLEETMKKLLTIIITCVIILGMAAVGTVYAKSAPGTPFALLEQAEDDPIDPEQVCLGFIDHPDLLELAALYEVDYEVDYEDLLFYFCEGIEVVDIQLALETAAHEGIEFTFEDILAMRFVEGEVVLTWEEIWENLGITDMEVPEEEEEEEEGEGAVCRGDMIHPVLTSMALEYVVDYQTLVGYFCQGLGVGEIKLALQTASKENVEMTYEELLGMRLSDGDDEMGLIGKIKQNTEETQEMETLEYKKNNKPAVPPGQAKEKPNKKDTGN
jgi:hypothetical protein